MKIGKNFAIVEIINDLNGGLISIKTPNSEDRPLKVARIAKVARDCANPWRISLDAVVVIDDTFILYWLDDYYCVIELAGILCRYSIAARECLAFDHEGQVDTVVVKMSIPDDDVLLRNTFVQTGLVVIGGIQSDINNVVFDLPVAITASPTTVKHIVTDVGDYYITDVDNIILVFELPDVVVGEPI